MDAKRWELVLIKSSREKQSGPAKYGYERLDVGTRYAEACVVGKFKPTH